MKYKKTMAGLAGGAALLLAGTVAFGGSSASASIPEPPPPPPPAPHHVISGTVTTADGKLVDNVSVEAYSGKTKVPTASAITYGGEYELEVPEGPYTFLYHDLSGKLLDKHVTKALTVKADVTLPATVLYYPAPTLVKAPTIGGYSAGRVFIATVGGDKWSSVPVERTINWYRDGKRVAGGSEYRLTPEDLISKLTATVTVRAENSAAASAKTKPLQLSKRFSSNIKLQPVTSDRRHTNFFIFVISGTGNPSGEVTLREVGSKKVLYHTTVKITGSSSPKLKPSVKCEHGKVSYVAEFKGNAITAPDSVTVEVRNRAC